MTQCTAHTALEQRYCHLAAVKAAKDAETAAAVEAALAAHKLSEAAKLQPAAGASPDEVAAAVEAALAAYKLGESDRINAAVQKAKQEQAEEFETARTAAESSAVEKVKAARTAAENRAAAAEANAASLRSQLAIAGGRAEKRARLMESLFEELPSEDQETWLNAREAGNYSESNTKPARRSAGGRSLESWNFKARLHALAEENHRGQATAQSLGQATSQPWGQATPQQWDQTAQQLRGQTTARQRSQTTAQQQSRLSQWPRQPTHISEVKSQAGSSPNQAQAPKRQPLLQWLHNLDNEYWQHPLKHDSKQQSVHVSQANRDTATTKTRKVDATYVINLDRSTNRWLAVTKTLDSTGLAYQRFRAVDGYKIMLHDTTTGANFTGSDLKNRKAVIKQNIKYRVICNPEHTHPTHFYYQGGKLTAGEFGAWCSNMLIWKEAVLYNYSNTIIFEDDIVIKTKDFVKKLETLIVTLPNTYDIALLDGAVTGGAFQPQDHISHPYVRLDQRALRWNYLLDAYVISIQAAQKLIGIDSVSSAIDIELARLSRNEPHPGTVHVLDVYAAAEKLISLSGIASETHAMGRDH